MEAIIMDENKKDNEGIEDDTTNNLTVKELFQKAKDEKLIQQPPPRIYPKIYHKFKDILEKHKKNSKEWK
jgi:hypothetical protein